MAAMFEMYDILNYEIYQKMSIFKKYFFLIHL